jgi:hypothetical protein
VSNKKTIRFEPLTVQSVFAYIKTHDPLWDTTNENKYRWNEDTKTLFWSKAACDQFQIFSEQEKQITLKEKLSDLDAYSDAFPTLLQAYNVHILAERKTRSRPVSQPPSGTQTPLKPHTPTLPPLEPRASTSNFLTTGPKEEEDDEEDDTYWGFSNPTPATVPTGHQQEETKTVPLVVKTEDLPTQATTLVVPPPAPQITTPQHTQQPQTPVSAMSDGTKNSITPTAFTGERERTKNFLDECELYFEARPQDFQDANKAWDEQKKMAFVLALMKDGNARIWRNKYREDAPRMATTWRALKQKIGDDFKDTNAAETARARLRALTQGKDDVDTYNANFNKLVGTTGYNEEAQIDAYMNGLNRRVATQIALMATPPTTLLDAQNNAVRIYMAFGREYTKNSNWRDRRNEPGSRSNPIQINRQRLSDEQAYQYRREGRCFNCHKTGHIARECPDRKKSANNWTKKGSTNASSSSSSNSSNWRSSIQGRKAKIEAIDKILGDSSLGEFNDIISELKGENSHPVQEDFGNDE